MSRAPKPGVPCPVKIIFGLDVVVVSNDEAVPPPVAPLVKRKLSETKSARLGGVAASRKATLKEKHVSFFMSSSDGPRKRPLPP
jgi:hypothetical protein